MYGQLNRTNVGVQRCRTDCVHLHVSMIADPMAIEAMRAVLDAALHFRGHLGVVGGGVRATREGERVGGRREWRVWLGLWAGWSGDGLKRREADRVGRQQG